jgi:hypothetical protein
MTSIGIHGDGDRRIVREGLSVIVPLEVEIERAKLSVSWVDGCVLG